MTVAGDPIITIVNSHKCTKESNRKKEIKRKKSNERNQTKEIKRKKEKCVKESKREKERKQKARKRAKCAKESKMRERKQNTQNIHTISTACFYILYTFVIFNNKIWIYNVQRHAKCRNMLYLYFELTVS